MKAVFKSIPNWLLTGILCGLAAPAFPGISTGFLAWFGFVPLFLSFKKIRNFTSYLFQTLAACFIINLGTGWWTSYYGWQALGVVLTIHVVTVWLPFGVFYLFLRRWGWKRSLLIFPFVWTSCEWLAHFLAHNLQVTVLAYSQSNFYWLVQFADITGMWGISFWLTGLNVLLALLMDKYFNNEQNKIFYAVGVAAYIALPIIYSAWVIDTEDGVEGNRTAQVALIQTNQNSYSDYYKGRGNDMMNELISLCDSAAHLKSQPDLMVLPEGALPFPLFRDSALFHQIRSTVAGWGTSVAAGFTDPDTVLSFYKNNSIVAATLPAMG